MVVLRVVVEPLLDRVARQLDAVVHLELAQGVLHVVLHGAVREHEPLGDLLVGHALGDHPQDLGLALGQRGLRRVGLRPAALVEPSELAEHQSGEPRREHGVPVCHPTYGVEQLGPRRRLHEVAGRAGLHRVEHVGLLAGGGQDEDASARILLEDLRGHLHAVRAGDLEVQHDDLRPAGREARQCLVAVGRDPDDVEARGLQVALHRVPPHRVVVDHHHPDPGSVDGHDVEPNRKYRPRR